MYRIPDDRERSVPPVRHEWQHPNLSLTNALGRENSNESIRPPKIRSRLPVRDVDVDRTRLIGIHLVWFSLS